MRSFCLKRSVPEWWGWPSAPGPGARATKLMQKTMEQKMSLDSSAPPRSWGRIRPGIRGPPAKEDGGDPPWGDGGVFAQGWGARRVVPALGGGGGVKCMARGGGGGGCRAPPRAGGWGEVRAWPPPSWSAIQPACRAGRARSRARPAGPGSGGRVRLTPPVVTSPSCP